MPDIRNFLLSDVEEATKRNALLGTQNDAARQQMAQSAQIAPLQLANQREVLTANRQTNQRAGLENAVGALSVSLRSVLGSPDILGAASQLTQSPAFQKQIQMMGGDPSQFQIDQNDTPESVSGEIQQFLAQLDQNMTGTNAQVDAFKYMTQGLTPEQVRQARMIDLGLAGRASPSRVVTINGVETLVENGPTGPKMTPLSNLSQEQMAAYGLANAERAGTEAAVTAAIPGQVEARGNAERSVDLRNMAPTAYRAAEYAVSELDKFTEQAKRLRNHPGLQQATGFGGEALSGIPGTPAADAAALLETLKAQAFISALGAMREASKTGGAVGNVSDAEGGRFENAFVALQQAQSYPQFVQELDRLISLNENTKNRIQSAYSSEYGGVQGAPSFGVGPPSQNGNGGPVRISSDTEYDSLQSGTQFIGPDGVLRTKP